MQNAFYMIIINPLKDILRYLCDTYFSVCIISKMHCLKTKQTKKPSHNKIGIKSKPSPRQVTKRFKPYSHQKCCSVLTHQMGQRAPFLGGVSFPKEEKTGTNLFALLKDFPTCQLLKLPYVNQHHQDVS